jgi:hypothetical protein
MKKKSSELLILIQNEKFLRTIFNELHHKMQLEKFYNLHEKVFRTSAFCAFKI